MTKIDFSILDGNASLWPHLISAIEEVPLLSDITYYHAAVGKLWDHFTNILRQQPQRHLCIGAIVGADAVEFIAYTLDGPIRSGKLDLSFDSQSTGFVHLVGFLCSSKEALGYIDPRPMAQSQIHIPQFGLEYVLRLPDDAGGTLIASGVYEGQKVILKRAPRERSKNELEILQRLCDLDIPHVPRLLHFTDFDNITMIMSPLGEHLEAVKHGVRQCISAMKDVLNTLAVLASHGIIHRDVSYGNIVLHNGKGILIDFHASTMDIHENDRPPFTMLFAPIEVHTAHVNRTPTPPHPTHDLESWFYTFLHIATDYRLKWRHNHSHRHVRNAKIALMGGCWGEQAAFVLPDFTEIIDDLHGELFKESGGMRRDVRCEDAVGVLERYLV
ncbi:hypothetical protein HDV00_000778 [Rhizophlyctis rosea]|nr:hypothetical protein HDV00_000778 [Rhizophlyctis rosea]